MDDFGSKKGRNCGAVSLPRQLQILLHGGASSIICLARMEAVGEQTTRKARLTQSRQRKHP